MKRKDFYKVEQIGERAYRIGSEEAVFCDLLVGDEKALLIDTTYGIGDLYGTVKNITDKPIVIVCTHGHVDHTCGAAQFLEPIYLAEEDFALCKRHNSKKQREFTIHDMQNKEDYFTHLCRNILPEDFDCKEYLSQREGTLLKLEEGMIFDLGGITVEVIRTPGHTKGGMSFYYREEEWLYSGDAYGFFLWLFDQDSTDRKTYIEGIDKVIALNPKRIYGGHNPVPMSPEELKVFRKTAFEADFAKGEPFHAAILEVEQELPEIRVCVSNGMTMDDFGKPGFAAIVIDEKR